MGRRRKDPLRPKRPITAFMSFSTVRRRQLMAEKPLWDFARLSRSVGKAWRAMSAAQRAPYEKSYQKDRARYVREMSTYVPPPESSSEESESEEEEDSAEDSDGSSSGGGSGDSASDDGYSSGSEEDEAGSGGKAHKAHAPAGPPYPRQEYCAPAARVPELSGAFLALLPPPPPLVMSVPLASEVRRGTQRAFWAKLEESVAAAAEIHWEALGVAQAARSPLPGFGKHIVLSQTRRQIACFVAVLDGKSASVPVPSGSPAGGAAGSSAAHARYIMPSEAVSDLYARARPVYIGQSDLLIIPSLDELLTVPRRMLDSCDPALLVSLSEQAANDNNEMRVRRCIYVRKKKADGTEPGRAGIVGSGLGSKRAQTEFCTLSGQVPWMAFMAEVLVCIFEIEFTPRDNEGSSSKKRETEREGRVEEGGDHQPRRHDESGEDSVDTRSSSADIDSNGGSSKPRKKRRRRSGR